MQKVREFVLLEGLQSVKQFLDVFVARVRFGNALDFFQVAGHPILADTPEAGFPRVVGYEKERIGQASVIVSLAVVFLADGHIIGLALYHDEGWLAVLLVLNGAPDAEIRSGRTCSPSTDL